MSSMDLKDKTDSSLTITSLNVVFLDFCYLQKAALEERASLAGYTIPAWSDLPGCEYGFDVIKKGVFMEHIDIHTQPLFFVGMCMFRCGHVQDAMRMFVTSFQSIPLPRAFTHVFNWERTEELR